jgi:thioredoxin-like negative regulator of GroEL
MAPIVHGLESEWQGRVEFAFVNVADPATRAVRARLGFAATPHFFFLDSAGTVQASLQGAVPRESLEVRLRHVSGLPR